MKKYSLKGDLNLFEKIVIFELNPRSDPQTIFKSKGEAKILKIFNPTFFIVALIIFLLLPTESIIPEKYRYCLNYLLILITTIFVLIEHFLLLSFKANIDPVELQELYLDIEKREECIRRERIIKLRTVLIFMAFVIFLVLTILSFRSIN